MINPVESDIGRAVVYRSPGGKTVEKGAITSFNDHFVFVLYEGDTVSKATRRENLTWDHAWAGATGLG